VEIRKMQEYKLTPIIACTGYIFRNEKDFIIARGATHYLEKPFYKQVLIDLLKEVTQS
jgi:CheY-like chemotaxis protein